MTHVRRPNRRRLPELNAIAAGEVCAIARKIRYPDEASARHALTELARHDPAPNRLSVYRHGGCGDFHVGHSS